MSAVITPNTTNVTGLAGSAMVPEKIINLQVAQIDQVLILYAELTGRTVLRPTALPAATVTLRNQQELTREEAIQALESVLGLNGITMINVGEKFVSAVPTQQALQEGAAFSREDPKGLAETGQFVSKVIQLKHALPSEVQQVISTFSKVQNGIVAIDSTMTLVLRDYPANIKRMTEMVEKIDVQAESEYKLEVIPIKYGRVEDLYSTMSALIGGGGGGAATTGAAAGTSGVRRTGPTMRGSTLGTGTRSRYGTSGTGYGGYGGYNTGYGSRYNQGGAYYPQASTVSPATGGTTASSFSQRLQQVVSRMSGKGAGTELETLQDARIVPDERSNSLIVFATKEHMQMITNIVSKVDRLLAQVLIEAIIMDVELNDSMSFGISALMRPQQNGSLTSVASMNSGASLLSGVTNLTSGLPEGFNYFGRFSGDLDFAIKALASDARGQVLATPRVQTSHAIPASFEVGESVPYVTSTYYGGYGYGPSAQLQQLDVTTFLNVTPYITPDGLVVMEIEQNIEEITGYTEIANVGKMPNTTHRSTTTTVSVQDRDTIMLGGYIRSARSKQKSGVPVLKDIPILGGLFRSTSRDSKRSELIVLMRPTVLANPKEAAEAARLEKERLPGIREMEHEWNMEQEDLKKRATDRTGGTPNP